MPQNISELMADLPAALGGTGDDIQPTDEDEEVLDDEQADDDAAGTGSDDDGAAGDDDEEAGGEGEEEQPTDEDDDEFEITLDDDEEGQPAAGGGDNKPPANTGLSNLNPEQQYILENLPKIRTNIIVEGADGKDRVRAVEVYGWGQVLNTPGYKGFATKVDEGRFIASAQDNERRAQTLQGEYRQKQIESDTKAYTMRENRAIARDLRSLREEGLFPKFKGVPGSRAFNDSEGAKAFDEVVAFMNEENDKAGQAAQKGDAFFHISFRQAYRMLHPEVFDKARQQARKQAEANAARRVKGGSGGTKPTRGNVQRGRVSNINDLADEFASFTGGATQ